MTEEQIKERRAKEAEEKKKKDEEEKKKREEEEKKKKEVCCPQSWKPPGKRSLKECTDAAHLLFVSIGRREIGFSSWGSIMAAPGQGGRPENDTSGFPSVGSQ